MGRKENLQKLIAKHQRRLQMREEQRARLGINTPPEIIIEIEDIETEIEKLQGESEGLGENRTTSFADLPKKEQQYQIALHWAENGRNTNLSRFDLSQRNLEAVDLAEAQLNNASLWGADLTMANLRGADLRLASLSLNFAH